MINQCHHHPKTIWNYSDTHAHTQLMRPWRDSWFIQDDVCVCGNSVFEVLTNKPNFKKIF